MNNPGWDGAILRDLSAEWAERTIYLDECASTNEEARKLAARGAASLTLILTEKQTAGRGRRGQAWSCPPNEGLACSLIVRPSEPPAFWSRFALASGLAVAEALDSFGLSAGVKWPNDVWVGGRKICGILVEAGTGFLVVGVGLNINVASFPENLSHPATSIMLETGVMVSREEVLIACLGALRFRMSQIGSGFDELLRAWSMRCVLSGNDVRLEVSGTQKTGRVEGLSPRGELLLRTSGGIEKILQANEIRLL